MDIKKLKAEFEKLEYINEKLEYLNFDEHLDCYVEKSNGMPVGLAAWVNGAFYGFEQAAKAQAVPEGFVLVPQESLKVALFWMHEDIDPWQMGGDSFADLYEHKPILEKALVESQEPTND